MYILQRMPKDRNQILAISQGGTFLKSGKKLKLHYYCSYCMAHVFLNGIFLGRSCRWQIWQIKLIEKHIDALIDQRSREGKGEQRNIARIDSIIHELQRHYKLLLDGMDVDVENLLSKYPPVTSSHEVGTSHSLPTTLTFML
jgi:hypothetical protein